MKWGCWGHWGHWGHWGCWGQWGYWGSGWQGNHPASSFWLFETKEVIEASDFIMSFEVMEATEAFNTTFKSLKLMAKITSFWCFWTKIFLNGMMEFQVKFCHLSGLRLWRTGMSFSTKAKDDKSNFRISRMYRYRFYGLKVQFWWPNKCS